MNYSKKYGKGWYNESYRHFLASQGIKTSKRFNLGKKFGERQFLIGKRGDILGVYFELLSPHGPGIDFSKDKKVINRKTVWGRINPRYSDKYEIMLLQPISKTSSNILKTKNFILKNKAKKYAKKLSVDENAKLKIEFAKDKEGIAPFG